MIILQILKPNNEREKKINKKERIQEPSYKIKIKNEKQKITGIKIHLSLSLITYIKRFKRK